MRKHRTWALVLVIVSLLFGYTLLHASEDARARIVFGTVPVENLPTTAEKFAPLVEYLSEKLSLDVDLFISTDYSGTIEAMRYGHVDLAYIGAFPYILAHREAGAEAIAGVVVYGGRHYYSIIVTHVNSNIETLDDLHGRTFAFSDPASSSGHLYPRAALLAAGIDPERDFAEVTFAGSHESLLLAILYGHIDAGATFDAGPTLLLEESERDKIRILANSEPILHGCFAVAQGLEQSLVDEIQQVLLEMHLDEAGAFALEQINVDYLIETVDEDYNPTRRVSELLEDI